LHTVVGPTFSDATSVGGSGQTSFDVTVFQSTFGQSKKEVILAFRGTGQQNLLVSPNDLTVVPEFPTYGAAASQIVAMYNWWQRVSTPLSSEGPTWVPQYAFSYVTARATRIADAASTGELSSWLTQETGSRVSVTGSSLGGHLAMAFAGLFPAVVHQAVAFNSPGIADRSIVHALFAALGGTAPSVGNPLITSIVSSEANNAGDELNLLAGYPGGNFPGQLVTVPIEDQYLTDVTDEKSSSWNHDQRQVTDSLAVFQMLQRLDPSLTLERYGLLLRSAAYGENRSLENLVDTVQSFFGIDRLPLPAGNAQRDALHAAIQSISGGAATPADPGYLALAGRLRIQPADSRLAFLATDHFGALVALQDLAPLALIVKDPGDAAAQAVLTTLWQTTRGGDHGAWLADRETPGSGGSHVSRMWLTDRSLLLQAIDRRNAVDSFQTVVTDERFPVDRDLEFHFMEGALIATAAKLLVMNPVDDPQGTSWNAGLRQRISFGNAVANAIEGTDGSLGDHLYGDAGNDTLTGLSGNDHLEGGTGDDLYIFAGQFGVDTLRDADARGSILMDGQVLTGGAGSGSPNLWLGANAAGQITRYIVRDSRASATGKQLLIARAGDPTNTVTVDNFDLAAATSGAGYLGIRLDDTQALVVAQAGSVTTAGASSPFEAWDFDPNTFTGQSTVAEGGASVYTLFLQVAAQAGDKLTLALSALQDRFQAWVGRSPVAASGAVIALEAGQTQVSFTLLQQGEVSAGASAALSATFTPLDGDTVTSNLWTLQVQDQGSTGRTLVGDQWAALRTSNQAILRDGRLVVAQGGLAFTAQGDGNLLPGTGMEVIDNLLFGSTGADQLQGLLGNDALDGGAGNDLLLGGDGDDLLAGGAGNNDLQGGAGNDFILAAGSLHRGLQQLGPADLWVPPPGKTVLGRGATWGVFAQDDVLSVWEGAAGAGMGRDSQRVDAGDGDDHVIAGAGDDYLLGGPGHDHLDGMAGADIIDAGAGDDTVRADGIVLAGFLNTALPADHGADHVDAGAGRDTVEGGGGADRLIGGDDNDQLFGDTGGPVDGVYVVPLRFHGADTLHGDAGNDYLEGGGRGDVLRGGAGADTLWGDTAADNLASLPAADRSLAWGDDDLAGGEGNDTLVGGGRDDTLQGGAGDDALRGDESSAALEGQHHGVDLLDGEAGNDLLVGGGRGDTLLGGDGHDDLRGDDALAVLAGAWHGDDVLDGGAGDDSLIGGGGNDVLLGGSGNDLLRGDLGGADTGVTGFDGEDHLDGEEGDDRLYGGGAGDTLRGGSGNDMLDGGTGADRMDGGSGDDHYAVDHPGDAVFERQGGGVDTVTSSVSFLVPDHVEHLVLVGSAAREATGNDEGNRLTGGEGAHLLFGRAGHDTLDGGAGADTLVGGTGDDRFEVDDPGDTVVEAAGEGTDTVRSHVHFALPDHVEHLVALGAGALTLAGNALGNHLQGNAGNNSLRGGAGDDFLVGGAGDDVYLFARGDGRDTIDNTDLLRHTTGALQAPAQDTLQFGAGIRASEVLAFRMGDSLVLQLSGSADAVDVIDHFAPDVVQGTQVLDHRIDRIAFAADPAWDSARIGQEVARAASNRAPALALALPVLQARIGTPLVHSFAAGTFTDPDAGDTVRYSLRMAGGAALPDWLAFDAQARTFTARPGATHAGSLRLELRGSDRYGVTAGAGLTLVVTDPVQRGTSGDDTLVASAFGDTLIGGPGQDQLLGGILGDTYHFAPGDGRDTITEKAASAGMVDRLVFGNGIAPADITARRAGEDMVLAHHNGLDQITVKAWFTAAQPWVEQVLFADQTVWTAAAMTRAALVVAGTAGDDVLLGTAMNDTLRGLAGADTLQGAGGSDLLDGGDGHDVLATGAGAIGTVLLGADGNDRLSADPSARNTVFEGGRGGDSAQGSDHADTYRFRLGDGRDWITESETGTPTGAQDVLEFGPGIAPADIRVWRYANDLYFSHANGTDQVTVGDWFASTVNFSATARRLESVRFADGSSWSAPELTAAALVVHGTEVRDTLTGSDMDDILYGLGGDDRLSGGRGRNLLDGGEGDDLLIADDGKFTVVSFAGMFPIVRDYWASNLLRGGTGNDTLWATALARDTVFEGGPGNDTLIGSAYNDRYHFGLGDGRDTITETAPTAGHTDEIRFGPGILPGDIRVARAEGDLLLAHANGRDQITVAGWFLGAGQRIEALRFDNGTVWNEAAVQAALPVLIAGSAAADVLTGTAGADDIQGLAGHDVLNGLGGADRLQGGTGNDRLHGGDGADFLLGDAPGEVALAESITSLVVHARGTVCEGQWPTMEVWLSGTRVHSISVASNQWAAYAVPVPPGISAHSIDIVFTNDAYRPDLGQDRNLYVDRVEVNGRTLAAGGAGVVVDFGTGVGAFDGFNTSVGYGVLSSHGALRIGLGGNDQLDGGAGVDTLAGGVGNDLYLVDTSADSIVELPGAGHDIVRATVSYVLAPHLEDLELSGANAFSATGNAGVNTLRGTPWANRLDGAGGADMLVGGAGDLMEAACPRAG
jgi:Ca2+-binding RTX toxin-like protein